MKCWRLPSGGRAGPPGHAPLVCHNNARPPCPFLLPPLPLHLLHFPHLHSTGGAASSSPHIVLSAVWVEALRCAAFAEGPQLGVAQRAINACYLVGSLRREINFPGARAKRRSWRLSEVMGAWTPPGPKPAKKRPMCSPPGAGRKGRENAHPTHT